MNELRGRLTELRPATVDDVAALVRIRSTPEVRARWRGDDIENEMREALADPDLELFAVRRCDHAEVIGAIQWAAGDDPEYAHASVDVFLDPAVHGSGLGTDAVRTLCRYLVTAQGFHRLAIDPAADNLAAIRCYEKVGFQRVGIMRQYERGADGTFHDGLLMDLLAADLIEE